MRVEDLPRIPQSQINNNTLTYVSLNGIPFSAGIVDIASQISGVTGTYVINSQLSGASGVLANQTSLVSGYVTNNAVFVTGNQLIVGNKSISGLTKILHSPVTDNTNGLLISYENASVPTSNFYSVLKSSKPGSLTLCGFFPCDSSGVTNLNWGLRFGSNGASSLYGYGAVAGVVAASGGTLSLFGTSINSNGVPFTTVSTIQGTYGVDLNLGYLTNDDDSISVDFADRNLQGSDGNVALNWATRSLLDDSEQNSVLWNQRNLVGNWSINGSGIANALYLETTGQTLYRYITGASGKSPSNVVFATGNQTISGNKTFANYLYSSNDSLPSIDVNARLLIKSNLVSVDWDAKVLKDSTENTSLDWKNRFLADSDIVTSLDWNNRLLYANTNQAVIDWNNTNLSGLNGTSFDWSNGIFYGVDGGNPNTDLVNYALLRDGFTTLDWNNLQLGDNLTLNVVVDWRNGRLTDNSFVNVLSLDWKNRKAYDDQGGGQISMDWNNRIFSGNWNSNNLNLSGNIVATANNLQTTGSILYNLINASSAGVSSLNGQSGILNFTGAGNASVIINGQTITISGNNGSTTTPNLVYATGNQIISGNKIFLNNAGFSGNISGRLFFVNNSGGVTFGLNTSATDELNYFNSITGGLVILQAGSPLNNNSQTTIVLSNQIQLSNAPNVLVTPNQFGFSVLRDDFEGQMSLLGDGGGNNNLYLYGLNNVGITFVNDNINKDLNNFIINVNGGLSSNLGTGNLYGRSLILSAEKNTNGDIGGNIILSPGKGDNGFNNGAVIVSGDIIVSGGLLVSGKNIYNLINNYSGNQQCFTTGIISTGFDSYNINYPLGVFSKKPNIILTVEISGNNMYSVNITGRTPTGFSALFSDIIAESGVILHCLATIN